MNIALKEGESIRNDWQYATVKGGKGGTVSEHLVVTNRRIISYMENRDRLFVEEFRNDEVDGYSAVYAARRLWGLAIFGALLAVVGIILGIVASPALLLVAAVGALLAILGFVLKRAALVLTIYKRGHLYAATSIGASALRGKRGKRSAKKLKIKVSPAVAAEIVTTIGTVLNTVDASGSAEAEPVAAFAAQTEEASEQ